ncbi:hypothetical protein POM88_010278 [Heracleum sosnowskyi]|uniref:Apple domain-containing protein n=1 Tax=Heracleum sosnowskyi TaxID=360622 RepID=A0AAD8ISA8_9APIA|nr:hypothetical protein POM88_010278 [Heracleum sosnowskyi]
MWKHRCFSWRNSKYDFSMNLKDCEKMCLKNCSCTAYANTNITGKGSGCLLWFGELIDVIDQEETGQILFVRLAPSGSGELGLGEGDLPFFEFKTLANATNNFSFDCKLGEGGFGPVYKVIIWLEVLEALKQKQTQLGWLVHCKSFYNNAGRTCLPYS